MISKKERETILAAVDFGKGYINDLENLIHVYRELTFRTMDATDRRRPYERAVRTLEKLLGEEGP